MTHSLSEDIIENAWEMSNIIFQLQTELKHDNNNGKTEKV